uniref:Secreted protein n=1 Tax=Pygocentrus nattereri TaxID=42514 RepID=A0AAR2KBA0_PYGNA
VQVWTGVNLLNRLLAFLCPCLSAPADEPSDQQLPIPRQYAMAIRTARDICLKGFNQNKTIFDLLRKEVAQFNSTLSSKGNNTVYIGQNVIAATYKNNKHSEFRLLIENNGSAIFNLTTPEGRHNDCLIFYTYNSPCLEMCLNETADKIRSGTKKCIYSFLHNLNSLQGPTAFVFTKIYRKDVEKKECLIKAFRNITYTVPLYQCDSNCKQCEERNNFCVPVDRPVLI